MVSSVNGTTPNNTTTGSPSSVMPGGKLGKDEFLQLLVAQLRHQDPLNPMDGQRMAADLAQFSGLEQLVNISEQIGVQQQLGGAALSATNNVVAISTIGKTVTAVGDQIEIGGASPTATVTADFAQDAKNVTIKIYNDSGKEVASQSLGTVTKGTRDFGIGSLTAGLPPGAYKYKIEGVAASDSAGKAPAEITTYMTGKIDGVSYGEEGAMLTSGKLNIPIGKVTKVKP